MLPDWTCRTSSFCSVDGWGSADDFSATVVAAAVVVGAETGGTGLGFRGTRAL